jgi:sRNA-binding carbon storage regulator CsrA
MTNHTASSLAIDLRPGEQLAIDDQRIVVELLEKSGRLARLRITAPRDVKIERRDDESEPRAMREMMQG